MKKRTILTCFVLIASLGVSMFAGCGNVGDVSDGDVSFSLPDAPESAVGNVGNVKTLTAGGYRIDFESGADGIGIKFVDLGASDTKNAVSFVNPKPAILNVRGPATTLLGAFDEKTYSAGYSKVVGKKYGYLATATVKTGSGSEVLFNDAYYITNAGTFAVNRQTKVLSANKTDVGFQSVYSLLDVGGSKQYANFDYFIPSIIYKDSSDMVRGAIASNLNLDRIYVKETRTGLPLSMLRNKESGRSVAIAHLNPEITSGGHVAGGINGAINNKLQYGSIGYTINKGISVDFCYPSAEGPITYDSGSGWAKLYHSFEKGTVQQYELSLLPTSEDSYAKAMTKTFKQAYTAESPEIASDVDIDKIYDYNIEVFNDTYKEFGTGAIKSAGVPWSIRLDGGSAVEYTFQMGFVGQQIPVGYHLMSTGYATNNAGLIEKGKTILNFWTSPIIMRDKLPIVWWDARDNDSAGQSRGYPCFLRCFVDGAEGMLDAYRIALKNGENMMQWKNAVIKIGSFLVENQNDDGSFYRAYNTNGTVCTDTSDNRFQGTSKRNTPIAVRFLSKMYEFTGEEKYKEAAVKAADYCYETLYLGLEKYVGGTPDNPNTVDKEAAIYAMYCFNATYTLTKDAKYLEAAEHAAVSAMSWVYCYDFACPSSSDKAAINPFNDGGVSGFSLIATGHSGADNFSAYMYYEFYKTYIQTGDEFYLHAAKFLQSNSKLSTDYKGEMGWKYRALGPEASTVCDFSFGTVGVWLPWSGIANIEPIANMRLAFGNADISKITSGRSELARALETYGNGGKSIN